MDDIRQVLIIRKDKVFGSKALNLKGLCDLTTRASIEGMLRLFGKFQYKTLQGGIFDANQTFIKYEAEFNNSSVLKMFLDNPVIEYYHTPLEEKMIELRQEFVDEFHNPIHFVSISRNYKRTILHNIVIF